jgi:predicted phage terminase large subunit-like protein
VQTAASNTTPLSEITDLELLQGLQRRRKARENLLDYAEYVNPEYIRAPHNELIAEKLEAVLRGEIRRLMIFMQPRSGKTHLASELFPTYALGKMPKINIIQTGYSAEIALRHSRLARDIFCSPEYRRLFPDSVYQSQNHSIAKPLQRQASHEWGTVQGGSYYAVGIGGGVTGRGGNIILIDDPVKNRQDAESPLIQSRILDWYRSTLYTRLEYPLSAVIIIMTRWSPHDLAGVLLHEDTDDWTVINLPAEAEENDPLGRDFGAPLWEERCSLEELHRIRTNIGELEYSALYQQRPRPRGGSVFKESWIKYIDHDPGGYPHAVRSWDLATTAKTSSDHTAGALIKNYNGDIVISNMTRAKLEFPGVKQLICETARRDGKFAEILIEGGGMQTAVVQEITDILTKEGYRVIQWLPKGRDKYVIALSTIALFEAGKVSFVRGEWNRDCVNELLCFTGAPNTSEVDDQVDAITHGIIHLDNRRVSEQPPATSAKRKLLKYEGVLSQSRA